MLLLAGAAPLPADEAKEGGKLLDIKGTLKDDDAFDKVLKKSYHKAEPVKMQAGRAYRIDVTSTDFDTLLRLEDSDGKQVAFNDDVSQRDTNSRIVYLAPKDGEYRIIVTSYKPGRPANTRSR